MTAQYRLRDYFLANLESPQTIILAHQLNPDSAVKPKMPEARADKVIK
jgi:hypothetical protein